MASSACTHVCYSFGYCPRNADPPSWDPSLFCRNGTYGFASLNSPPNIFREYKFKGWNHEVLDTTEFVSYLSTYEYSNLSILGTLLIVQVTLLGMATRTSNAKVQGDSEGFISVLSSAVLEWWLIFLLFVDAVFSYMVKKFARFCKLQSPCILCSRLDHVLGNEKPGFYRDLICGSHKLEVSSLVFCHLHDKLANAHGMCECCLFSFVSENNGCSKTCRLLFRKLGTEFEYYLGQNSLLKHPMHGSLEKSHCSCCNEQLKSSSYTCRLLETRPVRPKVAEVNVPSSGLVRRRNFNLRNGLKKKREKSSAPLVSSNFGNRAFHPLSHVGYTELKITSESESEVPISDEDAKAIICGTDIMKEGFVTQIVQPKTSRPDSLLKPPPDSLAAGNLLDQSISLPALDKQLDTDEQHHLTSSASALGVGHGLEELNWQQVAQKPEPPALSDLISLNDISSPSKTVEPLVGKSAKICKQCVAVDQIVECLGEPLDVSGIGDMGQQTQTEIGKVHYSDHRLNTTAGTDLTSDQVLNNHGLLMLNSRDVSDAFKLSVGHKGSQQSIDPLDQKDSAQIGEDLKIIMPQISASWGPELSLNDAIPTVHVHIEEVKISEASSNGLQALQKGVVPIERNESGCESLDGSIVSEIEGETLVDRLKRQVDLDRKSMSALYKELEEERNASAIAANEAMAMITRLQEEKAALHMEALQYLRMMEEQAEYDVEALEKANDLLAEKEKELQDLEFELEIYRKKFPEDATLEKMLELMGNLEERDTMVEQQDFSCKENNNKTHAASEPLMNSEDFSEPQETNMVDRETNLRIADGSLLDFEGEKLYISDCLKKLEKKLIQYCSNGVYVDASNEGCCQEGANEVNGQEKLHCSDASQETNQMEDDGFLEQKDSTQFRVGYPSQDSSASSTNYPQLIYKKDNHFDSGGQIINPGKATDLISLENEVLDLNERLEAIELDRDFLEHAVNILRDGSEGVCFIQEIASHLRELRRMGIRRREQDIA